MKILLFVAASLSITANLYAARARYVISSIEIVGSTHVTPEQIRSSFTTKEGDTLSEALLQNDLAALTKQYANDGFVFAHIILDRIEPTDSTHIRIRIRINEGRPAEAVQCKVTGITETDTGVVSREFFTSHSPIASQTLLETGASRLKQSGLFSSVSDPELYRITDSTVGIGIALSESPTTTIDGVLGYNPPPSATGSSYISGFLDLAFTNIGGTGRAAAFQYQRNTPSVSEIDFSYREPWVAGIPIDATILVQRHDEDTLFVSTHAVLTAMLHSFSSLTIGASIAYDGVTPGTSNVVNPSHILSASLQFVRDEQNDPIAPTSGYRIGLAAKYGMKTITDSLGYSTAIGINTLRADAAGIVPIIGKRFVGSLSFLAEQVNSSGLALSDLFRVGGLSSLRGYREASFYVSRFAIVRIEPRLMVASRSYVGIFTDIGYLEQRAYADIPSQTWNKVGYGLSFLFETQIGYLEAAVANASGKTLDNSVLHFGIKTGF